MTCCYPLTAYRAPGGKKIVFKRPQNYSDLPLNLPCGQCIGCRIDYSRNWSIRCVHEASLHDDNCFITLTYDPDNLPKDGSLDLRHFQLFMMRLRFKFGSGIRFFHCGEYGENLSSPHYHALLFNHDFPDKKHWKNTENGPLYVSSTLDKLWGKGLSAIGSVTFKSSAYVARYVTKKISGRRAAEGSEQRKHFDAHYQGKSPEYATMSRRPGIGKAWFDKFHSDVYPSDFVVMNGKKVRPPRYYDNLYKSVDLSSFEDIKSSRISLVRDHS